MSNNPFLEAQHAPAHARYPDISSPTLGQPSWQPQPSATSAFPQSSAFPLPHGGQPPHQSFLQPSAPDPYGYAAGGAQYAAQPAFQSPMATGAPGGFRPSSSFGQQMAAQLNTGYGQPQPSPYGGPGSGGGGGPIGYQPTGAGANAWNPQQHQQVVSQFDPYAQVAHLDAPQGSGAGLFGGPASPHPSGPTSHAAPSPGPVTSSAPPPGQPHPREYVYAHKGELELWDAYAWKQLMNAFDALRATWDVRRREAEDRVRALGGAVNWDYGAAQEGQRLQGVRGLVSERCVLC